MVPKPLARVCKQASRQLESTQLSAAAVGEGGRGVEKANVVVGGAGCKRGGVCVGGWGGCLNGATSVFVILSSKKSTKTSST